MSLMRFFQFFLKKREKKLGKRLDTGLKIVLYGRPSTLKRGRVKKRVKS